MAMKVTVSIKLAGHVLSDNETQTCMYEDIFATLRGSPVGPWLEPGRSTYTNPAPSNGKDSWLSFISYKDKLVFSYMPSKLQFVFLPEYQFGWEGHQWLNNNSARVDFSKPIWSLKKIKINVLLSKLAKTNLYSVCFMLHNFGNWKSALKRAGPCQRDFKGRSLQRDAIRKTSKSLLCSNQGTT